MADVTSEVFDQTAPKCSLIRAFACHQCYIVSSHDVAHILIIKLQCKVKKKGQDLVESSVYEDHLL